MLDNLSPELSARLYSDDIVYRPPNEVNSILLEVAQGCSYGKCTFCQEEVRQRFRRLPLAEVVEKARLLAQIDENAARTELFLLGENTLVFPEQHLQDIFRTVHEHLPQVRRINMYARAVEVLQKERAQLLRLQEQGLGDLYIGVESGSDRVLQQCRKGETAEQIVACCHLLDELGIGYSLSSIIGLGGVRDCWEHATATAALYNRVHPKSIRLMTLTPEPGTTLQRQIASGDFQPLSAGKTILEERLLLEHLEVDDCLVIGTHFSNLLPVAGLWRKHKEAVLDHMDEIILSVDLETLRFNPMEHM